MGSTAKLRSADKDDTPLIDISSPSGENKW